MTFRPLGLIAVVVALLVVVCCAPPRLTPLTGSPTADREPTPISSVFATPVAAIPTTASHPTKVVSPPTITATSGGALMATPTAGFASSALSLGTDTITAPPARDLLDLQRRLHPRRAITPTTSPTVIATLVGSESQFWVANQQTKSYFAMGARLSLVTPHVYWFVEDGVDVPANGLQTAATFFETQTYPTEHHLFGSEWSPGIDNDPHLTVLMGHIPGVGGYFSTADEYPPEVNPYSNEREMIYINTDAVRPGAGSFNGTVAHEFMHMIQFNVHRDQNSWINEGSAELAAQAVTGAVSGGVGSFEHAPQTQLNGWSSEPASSLPHYGAAYLFMRYIAEQFGGYATVGRIVSSPGRDVETFGPILQALRPPRTFDEVFGDWVAANLLSDRSVDGGRYGYDGLQLHLPVQPGPQLGQTVQGMVEQLGVTYYHVIANVPSHVTFVGATVVKLIGADPHQAQVEWWSNHGDSIDSRLTRSFDLSNVHAATLHFWTWYDIEPGFDYAYVEASSDGGQTWRTLPASDTTSDDPNGLNYGFGFTGRSGGATATWIPETVDLTPYVGQRILLRFEYITDDSFNSDGFVIDGVEIPEIGYRDSPDANSGWTPDGFTLVVNRLPQQYLVEVIDASKPHPVTVGKVGSDGVARVDVDAGRALIVAVAGLTSETTHPSPYTLRLDPN